MDNPEPHTQATREGQMERTVSFYHDILVPFPFSDDEIEALSRQEPINDFRHLPSEEPTQVTEEI